LSTRGTGEKKIVEHVEQLPCRFGGGSFFRKGSGAIDFSIDPIDGGVKGGAQEGKSTAKKKPAMKAG
jgi:hypothetical protein